MRMIISLSSLGLTLALSGAALAMPVSRFEKPVNRHAFLERDPDQVFGKIRLPRRRDPDGRVTIRPEVTAPVVRGHPLLGIAA